MRCGRNPGLDIGFENALALRALYRPVLVGVQFRMMGIDLHETERLAHRVQPFGALGIAFESRQFRVGVGRAEKGEPGDLSYPASSSACLASDPRLTI